jgi:hypothetical protein
LPCRFLPAESVFFGCKSDLPVEARAVGIVRLLGKTPSFTQNQTASQSGGGQENERQTQTSSLVAETGDRYDFSEVPLAAWNWRI